MPDAETEGLSVHSAKSGVSPGSSVHKGGGSANGFSGSTERDGRPEPQISFASSHRLSSKREDYCCALLVPGAAAFGVFDGHSGRESAIASSQILCQRLLERGPPFTRKAVIDAFWQLDADIGSGVFLPEEERHMVMDGSTATIMLVENAGDTLKCMLAWCGDSTAVVVDVDQGEISHRTTDHNPDLQSELLMADLISQVRSKILEQRLDVAPKESEGAERNGKEQAEGLSEPSPCLKLDAHRFGVHYDAPSREEVASALHLLVEDGGSEEQVDLAYRALLRECMIEQHLPEGSMERRAFTKRNRTSRQDKKKPLVISTHDDHEAPHYYDLQMTRSICDWRASSLVLPHPDIIEFDVPKSARARVILATDGLWDIVDHKTAAYFVSRKRRNTEAADVLADIALGGYVSRGAHVQKGATHAVGDDTTVVVVDLNPSGLAWQGAKDGGCCSLQ